VTRTDATTTRCAILGQLALRDWSSYELARSTGRTLHWFWPRAESVIYAEARRLEAAGLAASRTEPAADGSRRTRTVYSITDAGRAELSAWLARPSTSFALHVEPLLRVHLARFGSTDDLLAAVAHAHSTADDLLADAEAVAEEYVAGTHLFQGEAHIRGLLFDALVAQAEAYVRWADRAEAEIARWSDLHGDDDARDRAVERMAEFLRTR
jgi:DNA-binding PadR family transcriptional regulator